MTLIAFIVAIGLLIGVHEYGHYRVAVACGVRVHRFGIATFPVTEPGPGATLSHRFFHTITKPIWEWRPRRQHPGQDTVFAVGLFPIAGYVQMLGHGGDERVAPQDAAYSFANKPIRQRFAIVAAGPVANLLLAIALYAVVSWMGMEEPRPVLGSPVVGSIAAEAGVRGGETVSHAGFVGQPMEEIESFEDLRWMLTRGALDSQDLRIALRQGDAGVTHEITLPLSRIDAREADAQLLRKVGIVAPWTAPAIGKVVPGGAAERAGLQEGDVVRRIGADAVADGQDLWNRIRGLVQAGKGVTADWQVERGGRAMTLTLTPDAINEQGMPVFGRIGAHVGAPPQMVTVRRGPIEGLGYGVVRTWEVSELTLRLLGRMVIGQASLKNLSGPLTIADYAGKSASHGLTHYLLFLALISVSLGVLNLLPLPVLDGGHLMYYLWEAVTGRSVSDAWMERLQRGGVTVLLAMMSIALFNDVTRLLG